VDAENLSTIVGYLLRVCPIVAIGTEIAVYHPRALVPYGKHEIAVYERPDAVAKRKERIEEALRYGVRFDYKGMEERAQKHHDSEGITATIKDMYKDLETAVEEGEYEEIEAGAEAIIGIARSAIKSNPLLKESLQEVIGKVKEGYKMYVKRAEGEEDATRKEGDIQRADYLIDCMGYADDRINELKIILKKLQ